MRLPFVYTPHPVVGVPPETLYEYLEGDDPLTGRRVIDEIVAALTKTSAEAQAEAETAPVWLPSEDAGGREALVGPDTEDNLQRLFYERGWTDGLPVILPTEERVEKMLSGTGRSRDELVGEIFLHDTKEMLRYTVFDIAVVAVMAGARPEHLPVILAVAATKLSSLTPSTTPFGSMLLVNGPIRNEICMNSGVAAFSPGNLANAVIGRAWTLMSICWGYGRPKLTLWSSQGNGFLYNNMCFAENEERSVWAPFHVQKGFQPDESVVSVFKGWFVMNSLHAAAKRTVGEEIQPATQRHPRPQLQRDSHAGPAGGPAAQRGRRFRDQRGLQPVDIGERPHPAGRYWGTDHIDMLVAPRADAGEEPFATWRKAADDELIPHYHDPARINIVVVGGETSPVWKTSDYGCWGSAPVDYWRPGETPGRAAAECADGVCGLPDPDVEYDDQ